MIHALQRIWRSDGSKIATALGACLFAAATWLLFVSWEHGPPPTATSWWGIAGPALYVVAAAVTLYASLRPGADLPAAVPMRPQRPDSSVTVWTKIRDGCCVWDANGVLIVWNRRYAEITSYLGVELRPGLTFRD